MGYYIKVENNVKLFVEDINPNQDKTILFIHGWPVDHRMYEYQFNQLPKAGYRCIAIDLRGFGNSDKPWSGYSYNRLADDIRVVIDTLMLENITLAGFSMGGAIAIKYMARHDGHNVSKLALFGAAAPLFTKRPHFQYPAFTKEEVNAIIKATYTDRPEMLAGFGDKFFARYITSHFKDWFQGLGLAASGNATAKTAVSLRDEDVREDLSKINVPTAIFHGVLDKICPFALAKVMEANIRDSKLIPFMYSGHGLFYCEMAKFNRELVRFMD